MRDLTYCSVDCMNLTCNINKKVAPSDKYLSYAERRTEGCGFEAPPLTEGQIREAIIKSLAPGIRIREIHSGPTKLMVVLAKEKLRTPSRLDLLKYRLRARLVEILGGSMNVPESQCAGYLPKLTSVEHIRLRSQLLLHLPGETRFEYVRGFDGYTVALTFKRTADAE